jgi:hypothetical protein
MWPAGLALHEAQKQAKAEDVPQIVQYRWSFIGARMLPSVITLGAVNETRW